MVKVIIFDYDGVIVDSFPSVFAVYQKICQKFGVAFPEDIETFRVVYGYSYFECLKNLGISEDDFDVVQSMFKNEIVKMDHKVFQDISEVITELAKNYKLFLVSSSHSQEVLPKIAKLGLAISFEKIYCGADQKSHKSALFKEVLRDFDYSPEEVIIIGDRAIDYDSAKRLGIDDRNIILVNYGWGLDKNRIGNAKVAENPKEILNLINNFLIKNV